MAPIIRVLEQKKADYFVLHTGQHYSYNLDKVFFKQLKLPEAKYNLKIGSGSHSEETAKILVGAEKVLLKDTPDIVLVEGDTNSVFAAALAATKLHISVGHVEAGLRSYDRQMPEEINRILTDHCADYLFAPTPQAKEILRGEGIPDSKIFITGNTIVDTVYQHVALAEKTASALSTLSLTRGKYFLVTIHRQENVDDQAKFSSILEGLEKIAAEFDLPVIYPIHPRARKMLTKFGLKLRKVRLIEPLDYLGFLQLESNARLILTDSGGVQEEACILKVPCVTLRDNTERRETIDVGANTLAGSSVAKIVECTRSMLHGPKEWANPFGDGRASERIVEILMGVKRG